MKLKTQLPDCPECQELGKAANEAHRVTKEALARRIRAASSGTSLVCTSVVGDDPALEPVQLALRALLAHVDQHVMVDDQ
jgi:hypothetical protein